MCVCVCVCVCVYTRKCQKFSNILALVRFWRVYRVIEEVQDFAGNRW